LIRFTGLPDWCDATTGGAEFLSLPVVWGVANVDTGGEFPSEADQPKPGKDGDYKQAKSWGSSDPGEFATSVNVLTAHPPQSRPSGRAYQALRGIIAR
jgi:hypothetical protein